MNILCKYEKKIKVHLSFIYAFRKHVLCAIFGKQACWGCYNLYFEALKGLLLKNTP